MSFQLPRWLSDEGALRLQRMTGAVLGPGLSEDELDAVEERFGFRFAADHRVFLAAGLPLGKSWPDWRHGDEEGLRRRLAWPVDGTLFDVRHNGFWHPRWGVRPEDLDERMAVAARELADVPQLVPVYSHRYLPGVPGQYGHPVLSVHQTDIIYYGSDLSDYIRHEFAGLPGEIESARATVGFWSYIVGESDGLYTTPHDAYATTADEARVHLRMLALERAIGRYVSAGQFRLAARGAVALGLASPALGELADGVGLVDPAATVLFERALDELDLRGGLPADDGAIRRALTAWWLHLIAVRSLHPATGADIVHLEAWTALDYPTDLLGMADLAAAHAEAPDEASARCVVAAIRIEAGELLAGPWGAGAR